MSILLIDNKIVKVKFTFFIYRFVIREMKAQFKNLHNNRNLILY